MTRKIRLSVEEPELVQILEALSEARLTVLAVKVNTAWLDEPQAKAAKIHRDTQFAEGLQTLRGLLFRLKGFLEAEAAGFPRQPLTWIAAAIKVETSLRNKLWGNK